MEDVAWKAVAKDADVLEGKPVGVEVGEDKVLLTRIRGTVFAVGRECPHYQEKLEKGALFGTEIECKSHFARIDVTTGKVISAPAMNDLPVYPVRVDNGEIYIGTVVKPKFPKPAAALGSDPRTFVIVGAGAAGNAAAETLRRQGFAGRIVMITPENERPYDRPNLSKDFMTGKAGEEWLPLRGPKFYPAQGIELLIGKKVASIDPAHRNVGFTDGESLAFTKLLLATGAAPRTLAAPGADAALLLRTAEDARVLLRAASQWKRAMIVGAGFIGLELASSLRERGLAVTVVAQESVPLSHIVGDRVGAYIKGLHEAKGVVFAMDRTVRGIEGAEGARVVTLSDGTRREADFVVAGLGVVPVVDYLEGTGIAADGMVPVDGTMQTSVADIYAAGDIAAVLDNDNGRRRVEHWVVAERQGARAALCMLGKDPGRQEVDVFWSKQAGVSVKYVGHAKHFDQVIYRGAVEEGAFLAGYYHQGALKAAATIGMAQEIIAVERLLRFGAAPQVAQFADRSFDLLAAARAVS